MADVYQRSTHALQALADYRAEQAGPHHEMMQRLRQIHFPSRRDFIFTEHLEACLAELSRKTGGGDRSEAEGILVLGRSGAGKSELVTTNVRRHPLFATFMREDEGCPAVGIRCAGSFTLKVLALEVLKRSGYPARDIKESIAWMEVRKRLQHLGVLLLFIDEVHHVVKRSNLDELDRVTMSLKAILNDADWPVVLVMSGVPECEERINTNRELSRRLRTMTLDDLTPEDFPVIRKHVGHLCREAGLDVEDGVLREIVPRLSHSASAAFGWTIRMAIDAIGKALGSNAKSIEIGHFAAAYAARTQASDDHNPFVARNWSKIVSIPIAPYGDGEVSSTVAKSTTRTRQGLK